MNLFDIIGPVMVGPSSSHTAGAARIGYVAGRLMGEPIVRAGIGLHGSFLATGKGHGTDRALVAGLLGMRADDDRIPESFRYAEEAGMEVSFYGVDLVDAHPNSVQLKLAGASGRELALTASSLGGGRILICSLNGLQTRFHAEYPTLIVENVDQPGIVTAVTAAVAHENINIATMQLYRDKRGKHGVMVLECDGEIPEEVVTRLSSIRGIRNVAYLSMKE